MGRPRRNPPTEEEKLELERRRYQHECRMQQRNGFVNKCKHEKIKYDTIKYEVGTMDRFSLRTMYISCIISILWETDDNKFRHLKDSINDAVNEWLDSRKDWDRKNKIYVFEIPEAKVTYTGSFRNVKFELHIRRNGEPVSYRHSISILLPLVDKITDTIKKSCDEAGLVLAHRPSTNTKGMNLKEYVEKLTNTTPSVST